MRTFDFSPLFRSTVGFDRLFDLMDSYAEQSGGYPPYNIERSDETHYRITLAVAGFAEKDLSIEVKEGVKPVAEFHAARHIGLSVEKNLALDAVCPIIAMVKTKGRK